MFSQKQLCDKLTVLLIIKQVCEKKHTSSRFTKKKIEQYQLILLQQIEAFKFSIADIMQF